MILENRLIANKDNRGNTITSFTIGLMNAEEDDDGEAGTESLMFHL